MRCLSMQESYYRRVINALGIGMLFFLLFLLMTSFAVTGLSAALGALPISAVAAKVIYQLVYGALYLATFMCPVPIMRAFLRRSGLPWQPMQTRKPVSRWLPLIVLGGITLILAQSYLNAVLVSWMDFGDLTDSVMPGGNTVSDLDIVLTFIVLAVVPGFCEEFLFRGAILTNLLPFGRGTAIFVSALAFALMHQNLAQFLYAFGAGILLGVLYERTGSIWNGVALHLLNNASSLLATVLPRRFGEAMGARILLIADAVLFLAGLVSIAVLARVVSKKPDVREGVFGRSLPASVGYAENRVAPERSVRLLVASPFGAFLIASIVMALLTALMLMVAGGLS